MINSKTEGKLSFRSNLISIFTKTQGEGENSSNGSGNPYLQKCFTHLWWKTALASCRAASGELNVAVRSHRCLSSQPCYITATYAWTTFLAQISHMERSDFAEQKLPEWPYAKEDSLCLALLSSHGSIKELNISHFNFLPTQFLWLIEWCSFLSFFFLLAAVFSADI